MPVHHRRGVKRGLWIPPSDDRKLRVAWSEVETSLGSRRARAAWAGFEIPTPAGGFLYGPTLGAAAVRAGAGRRSTVYTATQGATAVTAGMTLAQINTAIASAGAGAAIDWAAGTYPIGQYLYLASQTWTGLGAGAVLTGAEVVTPTYDSGQAKWKITGVPNLGAWWYSGRIGDERNLNNVNPSDMAGMKNQCFWGGAKLWQVTSIANLTAVNQPYGPGNFYHDTATGTIWLDPGLGNPAGHTVEISTYGEPVVYPSGGVSRANFTMRGMTVEKAGNGGQAQGAVSLRPGGHLVDCTVDNNHGTGIHMGYDLITVEHSTVTNNGLFNFHGGGANCAAFGNEVAYCETSGGNDAGYNWGWGAGESKWTYSEGLRIHHNWMHDGWGMGIWTDAANVNALWEENVVERIVGSGIDMELGTSTSNVPGTGHHVRHNYVEDCGHGLPLPLSHTNNTNGAGIFADQVRSVLIEYNWVIECNAGIGVQQQPAGTYCPGTGYLQSESKWIWVHHNKVEQSAGVAAGLSTVSQVDPPASSYFSVPQITYEDNHYILDSLTADRFKWMTGAGAINTRMAKAEWTSQGQDSGSTFEVG